jgi:hypothetical protein
MAGCGPASGAATAKQNNMRTAITLHRKKDGWRLAAGPDERADKQRHAFNNIGANWPKDVEEVRFQFGDGKARTATESKAKNIAQQVKDADKRAAEKLALGAKRDEEARTARAEATKAIAKAESEAFAKTVKAKEDAKKSPK